MPQHDLDIANASGAAVRADLNAALAALGSTMKGPSPPPAPQAGMLWIEDDSPSTTVWTLRVHDGVDWIAMGTLDTTGNQFAPAAAAVGLVNLLDNAGFQVNQRLYVSGAAVGAPNAYTLDRWRVVTSGQALAWSDSAGVRTVTAPAGGVEQVIEGSRIAADAHTLSWTGTAVATVNGNAVPNGGAVTLAGGANATVRFSNGAVALPQLQRGRIATPFEGRHPAVEFLLCARYCQRIEQVVLFRTTDTGNFAGGVTSFGLLTRMRATPSVSRTVNSGNYDDPVFLMSPTSGVVYFASGAGPAGLGQWCNYNLLLTAEL